MKRVLVAFSSLVFIVFAACTENNGEPSVTSSPPAVQGCTNDQSLKDLDCLSQIAQQICGNENSSVMQSYQQPCTDLTAQVTAGGTPPTMPPAPQPQSQGPIQIPGCSPSQAGLSCAQATQNFELQYKSTYGNCMDQGGGGWRQSQGRAVVTCVGNNSGIQSQQQFQASPVAQCQAAYTYQNFSNTAPPTVTSSVPSDVVPPFPTQNPNGDTSTGTSTSTAAPTEPLPTTNTNTESL